VGSDVTSVPPAKWLMSFVTTLSNIDVRNATDIAELEATLVA
jgi:hypothetical protein